MTLTSLLENKHRAIWQGSCSLSHSLVPTSLYLCSSSSNTEPKNRRPQDQLGMLGTHSEAVSGATAIILLRLCERSNEVLEAWSSRVRIHLHWLSSGLEQGTLSLVISDSEITCEISVRYKMPLFTKYSIFLSHPSNLHLLAIMTFMWKKGMILDPEVIILWNI